MKTIETIEKEKIVCDGCDYTIGLTKEEWREGVALEDYIATLRIPWDVDPTETVWLEFHFHASANSLDKRDCFRYWARNADIMKKSLAYRELHEEEIDAFMSQMLYR